MTIKGIEARRIPAGPMDCGYVAEAEVVTEQMDRVYVTIQLYDGEQCTVSKESVYAFLTDDSLEPASEFVEEYEKVSTAKSKSAYGEVFKKLDKVLDMLG